MKRLLLLAALLTGILLLLLPVRTPSPPTGPALEAADLVAPETLRDWIVETDPGYLLVDVRAEEAFLDDGLPAAISMPAVTLDRAAVRSLPRHRKVILYAGDTEAAAEAWAAVRPFREDVYVLDGGLAAWKERVLHPTAPAEDASEEAWADYRVRVAVARYFLGETDTVPVVRERVIQPSLRPRVALPANEGC